MSTSRCSKLPAISQGQFKKELPFDRAYTGQAYLRPFTHLPAKWLIRSAFSVIRRLSPALREDITGDRPYMVSPLAATAQALRAEAPGELDRSPVEASILSQ